jgi:hypothetical protein
VLIALALLAMSHHTRWSRFRWFPLAALASLAAFSCRAPHGAAVAEATPPAAAEARVRALEDAQRLLLLRMQVGFVDHEAPYGEMPAPPAFASLVSGASSDASRRSGARARWDAGPGQAGEDQRAWVWLTQRLEEAYEQAGDPKGAADIDEAALGRIEDGGYKVILRSHLARLAAGQGDLAAAHRWLPPDTEEPTDINLDSELRMARVAVAFAEKDWAAALRQLGKTREEVPFASRWSVNASVKRAHALEQLGELGEGAGELLYWMRGPQDRAMVLRVPPASFAQQIDRMVALHHFAPESYALAK